MKHRHFSFGRYYLDVIPAPMFVNQVGNSQKLSAKQYQMKNKEARLRSDFRIKKLELYYQGQTVQCDSDFD